LLQRLQRVVLGPLQQDVAEGRLAVPDEGRGIGGIGLGGGEQQAVVARPAFHHAVQEHQIGRHALADHPQIGLLVGSLGDVFHQRRGADGSHFLVNRTGGQ
jgi:hypothetical protein